MDAREFPVELTVAHAAIRGDFEVIPEAPAAVAAATSSEAMPIPYIPPEQPRPSGNRVWLLAAGAFLGVARSGRSSRCERFQWYRRRPPGVENRSRRVNGARSEDSTCAILGRS